MIPHLWEAVIDWWELFCDLGVRAANPANSVHWTCHYGPADINVFVKACQVTAGLGENLNIRVKKRVEQHIGQQSMSNVHGHVH